MLAGCGGGAPAGAGNSAATGDNQTAGVTGPALSGRVVDDAHLLSPEQANGIAAQSASLEKRTKHQFVVVTVNTLGGRDIAAYSTALGNRWGIGRKGVNDGALLVVAPTERKVRIAVGAGLRKALTDAEAKAIIEQVILPAFRAKHFDQGIIKGADRIMAELSETIA